MPKSRADESMRRFLDMDEKMFKAMLKDLEEGGPRKAINHLKLAFNEYCTVRDGVFKEKGAEASFMDVKAKIPNNLWIKLMEIAFS